MAFAGYRSMLNEYGTSVETTSKVHYGGMMSPMILGRSVSADLIARSAAA